MGLTFGWNHKYGQLCVDFCEHLQRISSSMMRDKKELHTKKRIPSVFLMISLASLSPKFISQ